MVLTARNFHIPTQIYREFLALLPQPLPLKHHKHIQAIVLKCLNGLKTLTSPYGDTLVTFRVTYHAFMQIFGPCTPITERPDVHANALV